MRRGGIRPRESRQFPGFCGGFVQQRVEFAQRNFLALPRHLEVRFGAGDFQTGLDHLELRHVSGLEAVLGNLLQPLCQFHHARQPFGLRARVGRGVVSFAGASSHLAGQGGDFDLGQRPFLPSNVDPASTLAANLHGLVEKKAFVRLIPQSGEVRRGIGSLPGQSGFPPAPPLAAAALRQGRGFACPQGRELPGW